MAHQFLDLLSQAMASSSRSTVLKPLGWLIGLTMTGTIAAFKYIPGFWFPNLLGGMSLLSIALYIVAYIYFGITDKDALRSEKYSIQKIAIQKGFIGDDQTGYIPLKRKSGGQDIATQEDAKKISEGEE